MRMTYYRILLCCICLLGGCLRTPEDTEIKTLLDSETARRLIADYIEATPNAFTSPGRAESADEIRKITIPQKTTGKLGVGLFYVDLDKKTYMVGHLYQIPDEGKFESWN